MKKSFFLIIILCLLTTALSAQERFTGTWFILTANGMALDIRDHNGNSGVPIHQWTRHDGRSQQWNFEPYENGTYVIRNVLSNSVMDIQSHRAENGVRVHQWWARRDQQSQRWRIVRVDNQQVIIVNALTNLNLDIDNTNLNNRGQQLQQWAARSGQGQLFRLVPIEGQVPPRGSPLPANFIRPASYWETASQTRTSTSESRLEERMADTAFREIERIVHRVGNEIVYDHARLEKNAGRNLRFRDELIRREVCAGYSDAVIEALQGHPLVERVEYWRSSIGNHAWNLIVLKDGREIYTDATWYDGDYIDDNGFIINHPGRWGVNLTFDINEFNTVGGRIDPETGRLSQTRFAWPDAVMRKVSTSRDYSGTWQIINKNGMAVDIRDHNSNNGVAIHQWTRHNGLSQQWRFERQWDDSYIIINVQSNRVMDIASHNLLNGTRVHQWTRMQNEQELWGVNLHPRHQRWRILEDGEFVRIQNVYSDRMLDVPGNVSVRGVQLQQWEENTSGAQQFRLVRAGADQGDTSADIDRSTPGVLRADYTNPGSYTFTLSENFPATIEIYVLGAGGGGQGGHSKSYQQGITGTRTEHGTGATGGGGAAAYMSFTVNSALSVNITVGGGGGGGTRHSRGVGGSWESANPGGNGGDTTVRFASTSLTVQGGRGGGGSAAQAISGGVGGTAPARPTTLTLLGWGTIAGGSGVNGRHNANLVADNRGGAAGRLTGHGGTETSFGGGLGALSSTQANTGAGGRGGYGNENGTAGGNGRVLIIVKY
ncbi:MAG: RICIN domain-containing protein [Treponema sp.]|nr:RICIN domain-containing protein [Treponema sp.]